ncbi:shikimate dehydrogenase family protein [Christiangramia sabulilitoris]|uniref:Shikimate dehydrogenase n=1 Tax=Christiangramia sabulilitoris TaxID=2583991 RepID=A0A550I7G0_9FLAO|nr:shikimate dehydrogenase [Christiangramia sabulilitoris]TRO66904.1 shikimate dehydrogenase [Christiangramia sabulilitoris]
MRTFGLIGKNIDYSFSRKYFSDKFRKEYLEDKYRNFDIPEIEQFQQVIQNNVIAGLNVTIPYKEAIIPYLDHLDPHAKKIQAVNTIKFERDGSLTGHNTDYWGFLEALKPGLKPQHKSALILGTGGASKAVAYALDILDINYKFVSRKPGNARLSYDELDKDILNKYLLIVNTTPLGTFPEVNASPEIPYQHITSEHLVFDLIYNPAVTQFMKLAADNGAETLNGLEMLKFQAERAWDIWNS